MTATDGRLYMQGPQPASLTERRARQRALEEAQAHALAAARLVADRSASGLAVIVSFPLAEQRTERQHASVRGLVDAIQGLKRALRLVDEAKQALKHAER